MPLLVTILFCVLCGQVLIGGSALVWVFIADINDERKRPHDGHDRAAEREARWYPLPSTAQARRAARPDA